MARLVAYIRLSTQTQAEGYGLEIQRTDIDRFIASSDHYLVATFEDVGLSGSLDASQRPGLADALRAMHENRADGLIIAKLDRLARSLTVQESLLAIIWRSHKSVYAADSGEILQDDAGDPMRTAMRQMVGVFAQLERSMIVKRMLDGRRARTAAGFRQGGPAKFGFHRDDTPDEREQAVLLQAKRLRVEGLLWWQIADRLNEMGADSCPRRATRWSPSLARGLLTPDRKPRPAPTPGPKPRGLTAEATQRRLHISQGVLDQFVAGGRVRATSVNGWRHVYNEADVEALAVRYRVDTIFGRGWVGVEEAAQISATSPQRLRELAEAGLIEHSLTISSRYRFAVQPLINQSPTSAIRRRTRALGVLNAHDAVALRPYTQPSETPNHKHGDVVERSRRRSAGHKRPHRL